MFVDPLAKTFANWSPYNYVLDNPIRLVDPDGKAPTPYEAAIIASHVYGGKNAPKLVGGWKVSNHKFEDVNLRNSDTGLQSNVYERTDKETGVTEYVYASAGTFEWEDVKADIKQLYNGKSEQYSESVANAEIISQEVGTNELTYVGHSLGGGLASANSLKTGDAAITFNAAALSGKTVKNLNLTGNLKTITAYIVNGEFVDFMQGKIGMEAAGTIISLPAPNKYWAPDPVGSPINMKNRIKNHKIGVVIDQLENYHY